MTDPLAVDERPVRASEVVQNDPGQSARLVEIVVFTNIQIQGEPLPASAEINFLVSVIKPAGVAIQGAANAETPVVTGLEVKAGYGNSLSR